MTIAWTDVTAWQTLWTPPDGQQVNDTVLAQIEKAISENATIFSSQFGFTLPNVAQALAAAGKANPANRYLFDKSQYGDPSEKPIVNALIAELAPDQWAIGDSTAGEILHAKVLALLYPDGTGWSFSGSYNLSVSAASELNVCDLVTSRSRAESFAAQITAAFNYVKQRDTQPIVTSTPEGVPLVIDTEEQP